MSDLIDRNELLKDLKDLVEAWERYPVMAEPLKGVKTVINYVNLIPSDTERFDLNSRRAVVDALNIQMEELLKQLLSAQPERMTNRQWVDFLSAQFDISRTSAKEMLHGMMQWKKEDNFKKLFNGGKT